MSGNRNDLRFSFIATIYNDEKLLTQLLDSLVTQDIAPEGYEIICVNDASTDRTAEIIFQYQQKHQNIVSLTQETNLGATCCRNIGVMAARGKYIWIVDHDDFVETDILGSMLHLAESGDLDLLYFGVNQVPYNTKPNLERKQNGRKFRTQPYKPFEGHGMWQRMVRRDFLLRHNIDFATNVVGGEDSLWVFKINAYQPKALTIKDHLYNYRRNPTAASSNMRKTYPKVAFSMLNLAVEYQKFKMVMLEEKIPESFINKVDRRINESASGVMFWSVFCEKDNGNIDVWLKRLDDSGLLPIKLRWELLVPTKNIKKYRENLFSFPISSKTYCRLMNRFIHTGFAAKLPVLKNYL